MSKSVGGSPQVPRIRRRSLKIRQKIGHRGDCGWTAASRRPRWTRPTDLVSELGQAASKRGRRRKKKEENKRSEEISAVLPSADYRCSRRTIRLGKKKRTSPRALRGERERKERRERDGNGGTRETGARGGKGVLAAQIIRNLWPDLDGQRKLDAANRKVQ